MCWLIFSSSTFSGVQVLFVWFQTLFFTSDWCLQIASCFALILLFPEIVSFCEWLCCMKMYMCFLRSPIQANTHSHWLHLFCSLSPPLAVFCVFCVVFAQTWKHLTQRRSGCSQLATCHKLYLPGKLYLSKMQIVFVQIGKCICQNCQLYLY